MTFNEIQARRVESEQGTTVACALTIEPPEWQQTNIAATVTQYADDSGVVYQTCGGGRRIIKKRIGGAA